MDIDKNSLWCCTCKRFNEDNDKDCENCVAKDKFEFSEGAYNFYEKLIKDHTNKIQYYETEVKTCSTILEYIRKNKE